MKIRIALTLLILCTGTSALAQNGAREKIQAAHAAYITQRIGLTPEEAEKFWPVYREYGEKRRELRQQMRMLRRTETQDQAILARELELKQQELDLEKDYTERLGKIIPAEKLVALRQAEADFRKLLLRQVQQRRQPRR